MAVQASSDGRHFYVRPSRFPLGTILEGLALLLVLAGFSGRWALAPEGNVYALDHWQGYPTLAGASVGLCLVIGRFFRAPGLRTGWYFVPILIIAIGLVASTASFVITHDVVAMNETTPPEELDPTTVRGDYVGAALGGSVVFLITSIVHGLAASTMTDHGGRKVPLVRTPNTAECYVLDAALRPGEHRVGAYLVNLYGWITRGPRLARMIVTSERILFVPPPVSRWDGLKNWLHSFYAADWSHRPPLAEVIQIELYDIASVKDVEEPRHSAAYTALVPRSNGAAWGIRLVTDNPLGVEAPLLEHEVVRRAVESAWISKRERIA
jgi:hypothetical protein